MAKQIEIGTRVRVVSGRLYKGSEGVIAGRWSLGSQPFEMVCERLVFRGVEQPCHRTFLTVFPSELEAIT